VRESEIMGTKIRNKAIEYLISNYSKNLKYTRIADRQNFSSGPFKELIKGNNKTAYSKTFTKNLA
jgi:hypothetical protein